jgi:hypothetical protein
LVVENTPCNIRRPATFSIPYARSCGRGRAFLALDDRQFTSSPSGLSGQRSAFCLPCSDMPQMDGAMPTSSARALGLESHRRNAGARAFGALYRRHVAADAEVQFPADVLTAAAVSGTIFGVFTISGCANRGKGVW